MENAQKRIDVYVLKKYVTQRSQQVSEMSIILEMIIGTVYGECFKVF